jgi:hypothetical protein
VSENNYCYDQNRLVYKNKVSIQNCIEARNEKISGNNSEINQSLLPNSKYSKKEDMQ